MVTGSQAHKSNVQKMWTILMIHYGMVCSVEEMRDHVVITMQDYSAGLSRT